MARPRKKTNITGIVYPIEDMELYKKSLGTVMLDIMEKQLGPKLLALSMEELQKQLNKQ
ncbi:hypothetical protein [Clostridium butyricum]